MRQGVRMERSCWIVFPARTRACTESFSLSGTALDERHSSGCQHTECKSGHATDDNTAIGIIRGGGGLGSIGNVKFQRISIRDTAKSPAIDYYYTFVDYSRQGLYKVLFSEPGILSGARHEHPLGLFQGQPVDAIEASDDSHLSELWRRAEVIQMLRQKTSRLVSSK